MSLLMVMTASLLVYTVDQRHIRNTVEEQNETLPNQINQPIQNPTMRWVFQMMEGIHVAYTSLNGVVSKKITNMTQLRRKIIGLFYPSVQLIYQIE